MSISQNIVAVRTLTVGTGRRHDFEIREFIAMNSLGKLRFYSETIKFIIVGELRVDYEIDDITNILGYVMHNIVNAKLGKVIFIGGKFYLLENYVFLYRNVWEKVNYQT